MTSRSLLTGLINSSSRALTSAVASTTPIAEETENTTNEDYELVTTGTNKEIIEFIEKNYGSHSSAKNYHLINGNINVYNSVYENVQNILNAIKTPELVTLITAIQELLTSSFNSLGLHKDNVTQNITISTLTNKVEEILTNKNRDSLLQNNNPGRLTITQTFTLAPVYNYYISIYGMPLQGQGFNPLKISYIAEILTSLNIDPYV
tara:strand:- start:2971 stop:3588 length:618 start_codon:yes stop_codon:yes gene_type:complete